MHRRKIPILPSFPHIHISANTKGFLHPHAWQNIKKPESEWPFDVQDVWLWDGGTVEAISAISSTFRVRLWPTPDIKHAELGAKCSPESSLSESTSNSCDWPWFDGHQSLIEYITVWFTYVNVHINYVHIDIYIYICFFPYLHTLITLITIHYVTLHYITIHYSSLHYTTFHSITLDYITLHMYIHHNLSYFVGDISHYD